MDPLSDVLALLKLQSYWSAGFDFGGDWSIALAPFEGIRFYAAISGEAWLAVDGVAEVAHVRGGDCLLLPRGRASRIASDLSLEPIDPLTTFRSAKDGGVTVYQGGGTFFGVGGHFTLKGDNAGLLLDVLPPIMHVRDEAGKAELRWCVERMRRELREPQPGGFLIAQQLAMMIFVQALRMYVADGSRVGMGWLSALTDTEMSAALSAMHEDPADRWTLRSLAERAGMSRTSFTLKFKKTVGTSPMDYLTRWRMLVAREKLAASSEPISAIALSLGYESESAFSTAFKRVVGCSPRRYGRDHDVVRTIAAQTTPPASAPQSSSTNNRVGIASPHERQRPRSASQAKIGTLSYHATRSPQRAHADRPSNDVPAGTRSSATPTNDASAAPAAPPSAHTDTP